jgi:hypothetical protein
MWGFALTGGFAAHGAGGNFRLASEEAFDFFYSFSGFAPRASDFCYTTKVTKNVAGSALHPPPTFSTFRALLPWERPHAADSAVKRLPNENRYIASQDTAADDGKSFACVMFFCRAMPSCRENVQLCAKA